MRASERTGCLGELQKQVPVHEGRTEQQEKSPEESQCQGFLR
jgi:hypothetical protein